MRRVIAYLCTMLVTAALLPLANAGGGGGGNKECVQVDHSLPWTKTCDRQRDCAGGCFRLTWISKRCIPGESKCEPTTREVDRFMKRAPCELVPNDPTCPCTDEYRVVGPWDRIVVNWCN